MLSISLITFFATYTTLSLFFHLLISSNGLTLSSPVSLILIPIVYLGNMFLSLCICFHVLEKFNSVYRWNETIKKLDEEEK